MNQNEQKDTGSLPDADGLYWQGDSGSKQDDSKECHDSGAGEEIVDKGKIKAALETGGQVSKTFKDKATTLIADSKKVKSIQTLTCTVKNPAEYLQQIQLWANTVDAQLKQLAARFDLAASSELKQRQDELFGIIENALVGQAKKLLAEFEQPKPGQTIETIRAEHEQFKAALLQLKSFRFNDFTLTAKPFDAVEEDAATVLQVRIAQCKVDAIFAAAGGVLPDDAKQSPADTLIQEKLFPDFILQKMQLELNACTYDSKQDAKTADFPAMAAKAVSISASAIAAHSSLLPSVDISAPTGKYIALVKQHLIIQARHLKQELAGQLNEMKAQEFNPTAVVTNFEKFTQAVASLTTLGAKDYALTGSDATSLANEAKKDFNRLIINKLTEEIDSCFNPYPTDISAVKGLCDQLNSKILSFEVNAEALWGLETSQIEGLQARLNQSVMEAVQKHQQQLIKSLQEEKADLTTISAEFKKFRLAALSLPEVESKLIKTVQDEAKEQLTARAATLIKKLNSDLTSIHDEKDITQRCQSAWRELTQLIDCAQDFNLTEVVEDLSRQLAELRQLEQLAQFELQLRACMDSLQRKACYKLFCDKIDRTEDRARFDKIYFKYKHNEFTVRLSSLSSAEATAATTEQRALLDTTRAKLTECLLALEVSFPAFGSLDKYLKALKDIRHALVTDPAFDFLVFRGLVHDLDGIIFRIGMPIELVENFSIAQNLKRECLTEFLVEYKVKRTTPFRSLAAKQLRALQTNISRQSETNFKMVQEVASSIPFGSDFDRFSIAVNAVKKAQAQYDQAPAAQQKLIEFQTKVKEFFELFENIKNKYAQLSVFTPEDLKALAADNKHLTDLVLELRGRANDFAIYTTLDESQPFPLSELIYTLDTMTYLVAPETLNPDNLIFTASEGSGISAESEDSVVSGIARQVAGAVVRNSGPGVEALDHVDLATSAGNGRQYSKRMGWGAKAVKKVIGEDISERGQAIARATGLGNNITSTQKRHQLISRAHQIGRAQPQKAELGYSRGIINGLAVNLKSYLTNREKAKAQPQLQQLTMDRLAIPETDVHGAPTELSFLVDPVADEFLNTYNWKALLGRYVVLGAPERGIREAEYTEHPDTKDIFAAGKIPLVTRNHKYVVFYATGNTERKERPVSPTAWQSVDEKVEDKKTGLISDSRLKMWRIPGDHKDVGVARYGNSNVKTPGAVLIEWMTFEALSMQGGSLGRSQAATPPLDYPPSEMLGILLETDVQDHIQHERRKQEEEQSYPYSNIPSAAHTKLEKYIGHYPQLAVGLFDALVLIQARCNSGPLTSQQLDSCVVKPYNPVGKVATVAPLKDHNKALLNLLSKNKSHLTSYLDELTRLLVAATPAPQDKIALELKNIRTKEKLGCYRSPSEMLMALMKLREKLNQLLATAESPETVAALQRQSQEVFNQITSRMAILRGVSSSSSQPTAQPSENKDKKEIKDKKHQEEKHPASSSLTGPIVIQQPVDKPKSLRGDRKAPNYDNLYRDLSRGYLRINGKQPVQLFEEKYGYKFEIKIHKSQMDELIQEQLGLTGSESEPASPFAKFKLALGLSVQADLEQTNPFASKDGKDALVKDKRILPAINMHQFVNLQIVNGQIVREAERFYPYVVISDNPMVMREVTSKPQARRMNCCVRMSSNFDLAQGDFFVTTTTIDGLDKAAVAELFRKDQLADDAYATLTEVFELPENSRLDRFIQTEIELAQLMGVPPTQALMAIPLDAVDLRYFNESKLPSAILNELSKAPQDQNSKTLTRLYHESRAERLVYRYLSGEIAKLPLDSAKVAALLEKVNEILRPLPEQLAVRLGVHQVMGYATPSHDENGLQALWALSDHLAILQTLPQPAPIPEHLSLSSSRLFSPVTPALRDSTLLSSASFSPTGSISSLDAKKHSDIKSSESPAAATKKMSVVDFEAYCEKLMQEQPKLFTPSIGNQNARKIALQCIDDLLLPFRNDGSFNGSDYQRIYNAMRMNMGFAVEVLLDEKLEQEVLEQKEFKDGSPIVDGSAIVRGAFSFDSKEQLGQWTQIAKTKTEGLMAFLTKGLEDDGDDESDKEQKTQEAKVAKKELIEEQEKVEEIKLAGGIYIESISTLNQYLKNIFSIEIKADGQELLAQKRTQCEPIIKYIKRLQERGLSQSPIYFEALHKLYELQKRLALLSSSLQLGSGRTVREITSIEDLTGYIITSGDMAEIRKAGLTANDVLLPIYSFVHKLHQPLPSTASTQERIKRAKDKEAAESMLAACLNGFGIKSIYGPVITKPTLEVKATGVKAKDVIAIAEGKENKGIQDTDRKKPQSSSPGSSTFFSTDGTASKIMAKFKDSLARSNFPELCELKSFKSGLEQLPNNNNRERYITELFSMLIQRVDSIFQGKQEPDAKAYKRVIADAIQFVVAKCDPDKEMAERIINAVCSKFPHFKLETGEGLASASSSSIPFQIGSNSPLVSQPRTAVKTLPVVGEPIKPPAARRLSLT